jgi:hydrophobe/amphiphile efflux-3 (HAE3) family protein
MHKNKSKEALKETIKSIMPAVLTAMIATMMGLLSLYRSTVPMIQDFGTMLSIGIVVAFFLAVLLLIPLLFVKDYYFTNVDKAIKKKKVKKQNRLMEKLVRGIAKFKYSILVIAILSAAVGLYFDTQVEAETDIETFMPQDSEALQDIHILREKIGSTEQLALVFTGDNVLTEENVAFVSTFEQELTIEFSNEIIQIQSLSSVMALASIENPQMIHHDQLRLFVNDDQTSMVMYLSIIEMDNDTLSTFIEEMHSFVLDMNASSLEIIVTGQSIIDASMMDALTSGRYEITIIGMALVFLSLLIIYRKFSRAILPLIPIALIVGWSGGIMYLFGILYTPLTATLGALIIGIGTEFTILISNRYYEEKEIDPSTAVESAMSKMSKPIFASILTTMGGFSALIISDFQILSNFGIMTLVNLSLALISTIIILPAILSFKKAG